MNKNNTQILLNTLYKKYCTKEFILNDPIKFPHKYSHQRDIELAAFTSALLAQGKRTAIIKNLDQLFNYIGKDIYSYIMNYNYDIEKKNLFFFSHFAYRTISSDDLNDFLYLISLVLKKYGSIKNLLITLKSRINQLDHIDLIKEFIATFYNLKLPNNKLFSPSLKMILADPAKGSACKRLNMFFRWMVRDDYIDFGIYKFIKKSELIIPLDTHVAKISREIGLIPKTLKNNNMKTAIMITKELTKIDNNDPVKFDFALFGYGINQER